METRKIGSLEVTIIGVGCSTFGSRVDEAQSAEIVNAALDGGINFFDTADTYGKSQSEVFLGRALARHRKDVVIATKVGQISPGDRVGGGRAAHIKAATEASLQRLGTEYVDLLQHHWPDPTTPLEETLSAFTALVEEGKAIEIGCSNYTREQMWEARALAGAVRYASATNQYSVMMRDREFDVLPECEKTATSFLPWFPLFHGMLTGKYHRGERPPEGSRLAGTSRWTDSALADHNFDVIEQLTAFATDRGRTLLELAFGWLISRRPIGSVIAGVTSPAQVRSNVASSSWALSDDEIAAIDHLTKQEPTTTY